MPSLLLLVGTPGSGKTHFSEYWCKRFSTYKRVSQDDLGSRVECETQARIYINKGFDVILDRCNFNKSQRKVWQTLAQELRVEINCIYLDIPIEVCKERILGRSQHPTQVQGYEGVEILDKFTSQFRKPYKSEGFGIVIYLKHYQLETNYTFQNSSIPEKTISLIIQLLNRDTNSQKNNSSALNNQVLKRDVGDIGQPHKTHNK